MPPRFGVSAAPADVAATAAAATAPRPAASSFVLVFMAVCLPWLVTDWRGGSSVNLVAGRPMAWTYLPHLRPRLLAVLHRDGTPRMEHATGWRVDRTRRLAHRRPGRAARLDARVGHGNRGEQRLGVGVQGIFEELVVTGQFDDAAQIHDGDALAEMSHHR